MDRGAWWATVHGVAKNQIWLSDFAITFHFHALEKEMATHSSVLAWRIPGMGEPGGLPSMGSHRVGHDWSDLAAAAAVAVISIIHRWCSLQSISLMCFNYHSCSWVSQVVLVVKNPPADARDIRDAGLIPGSGRSSGEGNGNPLQCSYLANSVDRGTWRPAFQRVAMSWIRLKQLRMHVCCSCQFTSDNAQRWMDLIASVLLVENSQA